MSVVPPSRTDMMIRCEPITTPLVLVTPPPPHAEAAGMELHIQTPLMNPSRQAQRIALPPNIGPGYLHTERRASQARPRRRKKRRWLVGSSSLSSTDASRERSACVQCATRVRYAAMEPYRAAPLRARSWTLSWRDPDAGLWLIRERRAAGRDSTRTPLGRRFL